MPISHTFLYLQENRVIPFSEKFDHSLLGRPKIIEIGQIVSAVKRD